MVYESRPGETFLLGASTWRIEDITFERVIVTPAPGRAGQDAVLARRPAGPPARAGSGARCVPARDARPVHGRGRSPGCTEHHALDAFAADNVVLYLDEQAEATGVVPDDRTVVVERFRDEIGDWRVCILSPFGTPVHAPWAMAIERRLIDRYDMPVETMWSDDGIVIRLPEAADELPVDELLIDPDEIDELVARHPAADVAVLRAVPRVRGPGAAAAAAPARPAHAAVAAAPARRRPAGGGGQVPDVPDPARDVPGVPAGRVRRAGAARRARPAAQPGGAGRQRRHAEGVAVRAEPAVQLDRRVHVRGRRPAGRAPRRGAGARPRPAARPARRRGAARAARPGRAGRPRARAAVPRRRIAGRARPTSCTTCCAGRRPHRGRGRSAQRGRRPAVAGRVCSHDRRAVRVVVAGEERFIAAEDAARYRDALGCSLPLGLPQAFTEPVDHPLGVARRPLRPHPRPVPRRRAWPAASACRSSASPVR